MSSVKQGFKIYGEYLEDLSLLSNFLEKYGRKVSFVQVNYDLLESYGNKKALRKLLSKFQLGLIIHLIDSDDILFLTQLMGGFRGVPLIGIVMHGQVAYSMKYLKLMSTEF